MKNTEKTTTFAQGKLSALVLISWLIGALNAIAGFDLDTWKSGSRGQWVDQKVWNAENPNPWLAYMDESNPECATRWYVTLGPLGLQSRFYDRDDYRTLPAFRDKAPIALTDELGLLFNTIEVVSLHSQSPSEGFLMSGDLVLSMDGQYFETGNLSYRNAHYDRTTRRQFLPHVGQLLDQAEGRGTVKIGFLRFPDGYTPSPLSGVRSWTVLQGELNTPADIDIALGNVGFFKITKTSDTGSLREGENFLKLVNSKGEWIDLEINEGAPIGQPVEVPAGNDWRLVGNVTSSAAASFEISTLTRSSLPSNLQSFYHEVDIPIDQIGCFTPNGSEFNPEGEKARNYSAMLAHRLAKQQKPNGSWDLNAYDLPAFATSICGYALLSTGDPQYREQIRKAAAYVATPITREKWTYTNGFQLAFLCDYYLQTGDTSVVPGIKRQIKHVRRYIQADYTAGHKESPGYGGTGWVGAGSQVALGLALASKTGLADADDLNLLDQMLARIRELARFGSMTYKRGRTPKNGVNDHGAGCQSGPYYIASLLRGGNEHFTQLAAERYGKGPYGSEDDGHATQTLHFIFSNLAIANTSDETYIANMTQSAWRFTLFRDHFGFIGKNNFQIERHSGDGAVGYPIWRTAGYLLLFNAHKKNLLLTGKTGYHLPAKKTADLVHEERELYNVMMRSWGLAEAVLGNDAPESFTEAFAQLRAFTPQREWDSALRDWLNRSLSTVIPDLLSLPNDPSGGSRGQLVELLYLLGVETEFDQTSDGGSYLQLKPVPLLVRDGLESRNRNISEASYPMSDLTMVLRDPSGTILSNPVEYNVSGIVGDEDIFRTEFAQPLTNGTTFLLDVSYTVSGVQVNYTSPITYPVIANRWPNPLVNTFLVDTGVLDDFSGDGYAGRFIFDTGRCFGFELWKENLPDCLVRGARYRAKVSMGDVWAYQIKGWSELTPSPRETKIASISGPTGMDLSALTDRNPQTSITFLRNNEFTVTLEKSEEISSLYLGGINVRHRVEALVGGQWKLIREDDSTNLRPINPVTTQQLKITMLQGGQLSELAVFRPEGQEYLPRSTWFKEASEYDGKSAPSNHPPVANDTVIEIDFLSTTPGVVGVVNAWDVDAGDSLLYTIINASDSNMFAVDIFTGEISLKRGLDAYSARQYQMKYEVKDFGGLTTQAHIFINLVNIPDRNEFLQVGEHLNNASHWSIQLPDANTVGYVGVNALIHSELQGFDLIINEGNVTRSQNNINVWKNDTDVVLAGGTLDYTTSSASGNTPRVLRMYDTSSLTMIRGTFKLWSSRDLWLFGEASLLVKGGEFSAGSISLDGSWQGGAFLTFGAGSGRVTVNTLRFQPESYIDFQSGSSGALTVNGEDLSYFQLLWTDGKIRIDGGNAGNFSDLFQVNGSTLTLVKLPDSDGDGLEDDWELYYFGDLTSTDGSFDTDSDGLSDAEEFALGTSPIAKDTDADGFADILETSLQTDPLNPASKPRDLYRGLYTWWKLDKASGPSALDSSGNGRHGIIEGSPVPTTGPEGSKALSFDGKDDRVTYTMPQTAFAEFTIALWVKTASLETTKYASMFNNGKSRGFQLETTAGSPGDYTLRGNSTRKIAKASTEWKRLVVIYDGQMTDFFLDGRRMAMTQGNPGNVFEKLQLGVNRNGNVFFSGAIDEMMVWSRALPVMDVIALSRPSVNFENLTYAEYAATYNLSGADADLLADPDGDGILNFQEWAMGGSDPARGTDRPLSMIRGGVADGVPYLELSWLLRSGGQWIGSGYQYDQIHYQPQGGEDLKTWSNDVIRVPSPIDLPPPPPGFQWETSRVEASAAQEFVKRGFLRIQLQHE